MVTIYPFKGLHPSADAFSTVPSVPYDVIEREDAAKEIAENPKSLLRIIRTDAELINTDVHDDKIYERAAEMFAKFKADGLLIPDEKTAFYIYRITMGSETFTGLVSCVSVDEYNANIIKKHELTRYDKEEDRTRHIDAVSCHTGQVFLLYKNRDAEQYINSLADSKKPFGEYTAKNGNYHRIYRVDDATEIAKINEIFDKIENLYIADGHHRAKSSANVCERRAKENRLTEDAKKFMAVLFSHDSVRIYGYHRLIRDLAGLNADMFLNDLSLRFKITPIKKVDIRKNAIPVIEHGKNMHVMHLYLESQWYELSRPVDEKADAIERLDVSVLQNLVMDDMLAIFDPRGDPRISFVGGIVPLSEITKQVDNGNYAAAFIMQPVSAQQVIDVADACLIMPPKSTWFEPKLLSGMVMHEIK